jgi:hypothetical protein
MKANSRPHSESRWIDQDRRPFFDIRLRLLRSIRAVAVSVVFASAPRGCGATVESRASAFSTVEALLQRSGVAKLLSFTPLAQLRFTIRWKARPSRLA